MTLVKDYLNAHADLDLALHVVWMPMFPRVAENRALPGSVSAMTLPNLTQYWDDTRDLGRHFRGVVPPDVVFPGAEEILWDAFLVFDAQATWDTAGAHLLGAGATIVKTHDKLSLLLDELHAAQINGGGAAE